MNVKEAVKVALQYVADLFKGESLSNIGLEEVVFDEARNMWDVTVGFSRPWDYPGTTTHSRLEHRLDQLFGPQGELGPQDELGPQGELGPQREPPQARREYKVVRVNAKTGEVQSVEIRAQT